MKKLILIDGNAMLHRAYHAMPELTNKKGEMVNAVYGFFSMFLQILNDQNPDYVAVCFDRSKPTIRQSMYAGYHAHRPEMASDLTPQVALVDELLEKMNVKIFSLDGYEGDDLIGTIAAKVQNTQSSRISESQSIRNSEKSDTPIHRQSEFSKSSENIEVVIVTGDRDMLQLVNENVKVLMPQNGLGKTVLYDEAKVEEKYGVKSSQFIDYKALIGDPSDGYPGVSGIGPKTAATLLGQFGTFENLYTKIDEVPQKYALKLATDAEQAALAKKLATIITDVPMQFSLENCSCSDFDLVSLHEGFLEHGFKSLVSRLETRYPELKKTLEEKQSGKSQLSLL